MKNVRKIFGKETGITLIALAITIVVMMILAGVAIGLAIGDGGILSGTREAVDMWNNAAEQEQEGAQGITDYINEHLNDDDNGNGGGSGNGGSGDNNENEWNTGTTVEEAKNQDKPFEEDTTIKDDLDNDVRIPGGFEIADDSGTKVEDGIVIEDSKGNQFVWIPAKTGSGVTINTRSGVKTIVYTRTNFNKQSGSYSEYSEALSSEEEKSVNANGGYYIGRYEAGDKVSTDAGRMRVSGDSQTNEVSIKKAQAPYNYISFTNMKYLAEGMDTARGYTATTRLASSYAWDTALSFIQINNTGYATSSAQGNYKDRPFSYANVGESEISNSKDIGQSVLVPTGQTTAVSNIYDMGGNLVEYTSEIHKNSTQSTDYRYCFRGGYNESNSSTEPASYRMYDAGNPLYYGTFRVTLFLKN